MSQTSYSYAQAAAFAGMLYDTAQNKDVISRVNPVDALPYGCFSCLGANPDSDAKLPAATTDVSSALKGLGVVVSTQAIESSSSGLAQYPIKSSVNILHKGRIWVTVEEAVVPTDAPFVRFAAGSFSQLGSFRKSADTATAVALPNSRFLTSAGIGGLALLELY